MKYKVGDKVRIKSIDWYNQNKDEDDNVPLIESTNSYYNFIKVMRGACGKVMTISSVSSDYYDMVEDAGEYFWTDEMIEGLAEETYDFLKTDKPNLPSLNDFMDILNNEISIPEGYIFKDENGNIINSSKIVLEKKKKEYPKTYEECYKVLGIPIHGGIALVGNWCIEDGYIVQHLETLRALSKLLICRDAYWKIAGEEMGLGKPWEYNCHSEYFTPAIIYRSGFVQKVEIQYRNAILSFSTEEMRDAFYYNFKELIESCKELL